VIPENYPSVQLPKDSPQKDNFHNFIFGIDKMLSFGIFDSAILISFLFPKGVVDGERPLKIPIQNYRLTSKS
jgi:hypothetical protein